MSARTQPISDARSQAAPRRLARRAAASCCALMLFALTAPAHGQPLLTHPPDSFRQTAYTWHSGSHRGPAPDAAQAELEEKAGDRRAAQLEDEPAPRAEALPLVRPSGSALVAEHVVTEPGAAWTQIHFDAYDLGRRSFIILTSMLDGDQQRLDAQTLPQWNDASGHFNGDSVRVQLYAAPGDAGVFARIGGLVVREHEAVFLPRSLCDGDDDRVLTTDPRVGRMAASPTGGRFCTAWLVSNGAVLTAGHCIDTESSGAGDGTLNIGAGAIVEFNVPLSTSTGVPVAADLDDQYPIDIGTADWSSEGVTGGNTIGNDWAVYELNPNANTGRRAHVVNGFFRMSRDTPSNGTSIRITGHGTDSTPSADRNRSLQTDVGSFTGEFNTTDGIRHTYRTDTTGGNSGSPVIWDSLGVTIGIHTNAGCGASGGANNGTSFENNALEDSIDDVPGFEAVHVDRFHPETSENGTVFLPYDLFAEGVAAVPAGRTLSVVEGAYGETLTITKSMIIEAPAGTVVIGN